jgi:xanthine/CO dehydrogenase XdhC/CoxF family maturation factor
MYMTHEFKNLIETAYSWEQQGIRSILATVVALEGSSYRRPGVRMLISDSGLMEGAVSGGCVEKEVQRQAETVLLSGIAKVITYDGRLRLGCEGILYILLEPISISESLYKSFTACFQKRENFYCESYFKPEATTHQQMGTIVRMDSGKYTLNPSLSEASVSGLELFEQTFTPLFQLYIFGVEHDAVQLCRMAHQLGWAVHIIAPPDDHKTIAYFKGATSLKAPLLEEIDLSGIDENTAVIVMSHSITKDLQYLIALRNIEAAYIGMLGPAKRRERLFSEFLKLYPDTSFEFFEKIYGPAGLNIGAESAPEIALSILAEILSVIRNAELMQLRHKPGKIHG